MILNRTPVDNGMPTVTTRPATAANARNKVRAEADKESTFVEGEQTLGRTSLDVRARALAELKV